MRLSRATLRPKPQVPRALRAHTSVDRTRAAILDGRDLEPFQQSRPVSSEQPYACARYVANRKSPIRNVPHVAVNLVLGPGPSIDRLRSPIAEQELAGSREASHNGQRIVGQHDAMGYTALETFRRDYQNLIIKVGLGPARVAYFA